MIPLVSLIEQKSRSTEPEAFFLELFFNAQELNPNPNAEARDQQSQRAPNALVPTSIAYAGGTTDFYVDMGTEVCPDVIRTASIHNCNALFRSMRRGL